MKRVTAHLSIGDFSRASHLTIKTLRHYHEIGLLSRCRRPAQRISPVRDRAALERSGDSPLASARHVVDRDSGRVDRAGRAGTKQRLAAI